MSNASTSFRSSRTAPAVLSVDGLVKKYGHTTVVKGVSFEVHEGEVVGLLGPNGAGKTTSFRMTCGLIPATEGRVRLGKQDVTDWPMYRRAREGKMGYLPQDRSVFGSLSTEKNLYLAMELLGFPRAKQRQRCEELLQKFTLTRVRRSIVGNGGTGGLSGGERRRLEIARALLSEPRILLLDEPFANVDPNTVTEIQNVIQDLSNEGIAILITDHGIDATMEIADFCYIIDKGTVLTSGTPVDVLSNEEARTQYFGEKSQQQLDNLKKKIAEGSIRSARRSVKRPPRNPSADVYSRSNSSDGFVVEDAEEMEDVSFRVHSSDEEVIPPFRSDSARRSALNTPRRSKNGKNDDLFDEFQQDEPSISSEKREKKRFGFRRPSK